MITKKYYKLVRVSHEDEGYLYVENISGQIGNFSIKVIGSTQLTDVEYSTDGVNWNSYDMSTKPTVPIQSGGRIYLRGDGRTGSYGGNASYACLYMDVDHNAGGNVYSLIDKNTFATRTSSKNLSYELIGVFRDDTHLISAEKINFGNVVNLVSDNSYYSMFQGCTSLTTAPSILPATTLGVRSYGYMFYHCTALTTAPELPATTLKNDSYNNMFGACGSLNTVKCLAEDISASGCTNNWLSGVSATGTFYKSANMSGWTTGASGIPSGWTVVDA